MNPVSPIENEQKSVDSNTALSHSHLAIGGRFFVDAITP
jgi:hypothetical protein